MIKQAILFSNEMVMVFDENGQQIPEYQGRHSEVATKIIQDATDETVFCFNKWRESPITVSKEQWQKNTWGIYPAPKT